MGIIDLHKFHHSPPFLHLYILLFMYYLFYSILCALLPQKQEITPMVKTQLIYLMRDYHRECERYTLETAGSICKWPVNATTETKSFHWYLSPSFVCYTV